MARGSFASDKGGRDKRNDNDDDDDDNILNVGDIDIEIDIEDDTPEDDRGRPKKLDESSADQDDDDEQYNGSGRTKKRIDRLKFETHTERRAREAAERERDEAVQYASNQTKELEELRKRVGTGSTALMASMKENQETRLVDAKRRLAAAHADGDSEAIAAATADMSDASAKLVAISSRAPAPQTEEAAQQKPPQQQQRPPQGQNLAPRVAAWIDSNRSWFNRPEHADKTAKAMSLHYDLVARGINPSDEKYTRELDKGLKSVYPEHRSFDFSSDDDEPGARREPRRSNAVTEGGRANDTQGSKRKITLTASQVAIAKKLGVSTQAYAQELLKQQRREQGAGA